MTDKPTSDSLAAFSSVMNIDFRTETLLFAGSVYPFLPEEIKDLLEKRIFSFDIGNQIAFFHSARANGMSRPDAEMVERIRRREMSDLSVVGALSALLFAWGDILSDEETGNISGSISKLMENEKTNLSRDAVTKLMFSREYRLDNASLDASGSAAVDLPNPLYMKGREKYLEEISRSYVKRFGAAMPRDGMPENVRSVFTESVLSADFKTFLGMNLSFFSKNVLTPKQKKMFAERIEECTERFGEVAEFISADPRNNHGAALVEFLFDNKELFGNHRSTCAGILKTYGKSDVDESAFAKEFFSIAFRGEEDARDFGKTLGEDELLASSGSRTAAFLNEAGMNLLKTDPTRRTFLRSECVILSSFLEAASSSGYALENVLEKESLFSHNGIQYNGIPVLAVYDKLTGGSVFGERSESFFVFASNRYAFGENPDSVWKDAFEKLVNSSVVLEFDAAEFCALALEKIGANCSGMSRRAWMRLDIRNSPEAVVFAEHLAAAISSESDPERRQVIASFLKTCGKMLLEHDETKDAIAMGLASGRGLEAADVVL